MVVLSTTMHSPPQPPTNDILLEHTANSATEFLLSDTDVRPAICNIQNDLDAPWRSFPKPSILQRFLQPFRTHKTRPRWQSINLGAIPASEGEKEPITSGLNSIALGRMTVELFIAIIALW